jgi:hypothetical protein
VANRPARGRRAVPGAGDRGYSPCCRWPLIAAIVVGTGHHAWFLIPLVAFFVIRPLIWRSWGWGVWGCGPRGGTRV